MTAFAAALAALAIAAAPVASQVPVEIGKARGEISKESFFKPGLAPVRNPRGYDVTVVYFMDYQCPACRKYTPDVTRAFEEDPRVRVIYRDTPIFGPRSEQAARVAIASQFQGKHEAMHLALMTADMPLDAQAIEAAAAKAGVDWARLQRDLTKRSDDIDLQIAWNSELARSAGVAGTPAFIIGDVLADGVLDYRGLRESIADARRASKAQPAPERQSVASSPPTTDEAKAKVGETPSPPAAEPPAAPAKTVSFRAPASPPLQSNAPAPKRGSLPLAWIAVAIVAAAIASLAFVRLRRRSR